MDKSTIEEDDIRLISRYIQEEIILISYYKKTQYLDIDSLSKTFNLNFSNIKYFDKEDQKITEFILESFIDNLQNINIDITNASNLHSALLSGMSARYDINVFYQTEKEMKISLIQHTNYYDDATESEIQILKQMNCTAQRTNQLLNAANNETKICRSNAYKLLESMKMRGIITEKKPDLPSDYKKKSPFGYAFTIEQKADFTVFLKRLKEHNKIREDNRKKKKERTIMRKSSLHK